MVRNALKLSTSRRYYFSLIGDNADYPAFQFPTTLRTQYARDQTL